MVEADGHSKTSRELTQRLECTGVWRVFFASECFVH